MNVGELRFKIRKLEAREKQLNRPVNIMTILFCMYGLVSIGLLMSEVFENWITLVPFAIFFLAMLALVSFRDKLEKEKVPLVEMLKGHTLVWQGLQWTPEHFCQHLRDLIPGDENTLAVQFGKQLVSLHGMRSYVFGDIVEACRGEKKLPYFAMPGMITLFLGSALKQTTGGLEWSDEIREKFFELHPMPDDFTPDPPIA
jgi:hypothetical protein